MIRRCLLLAIAVATLSILMAAPAQAGFLKAIWGPIKVPPGSGGCPPSPNTHRCDAMHFYDELGADVFEYQLQWNEIAPTRPANPRNPNDPAYLWSNEFQHAIDEANANGMQVSFLIKGSPPWANGGKSWNWVPSAAAYADFARAAAAKFPSVRIWQIWGEPSRYKNFMPQGSTGAGLYAQLLDAAYYALKASNPKNIVVGGMTFFGGATRTPLWIKYLRLPNGKPPHMDWYGHNPFEERFPNIRAKPIKQLRGVSDLDTLWGEVKRHYQRRVRNKKRPACRVRRYAKRHPRRCFRRRWIYKTGRPTQLWLSEWGIQTDRASYIFPYFVSRARQVDYLKAAFALARSLPYVKGMGWYQLIDYPPTPSNNPTWGLLEYDGDPKPVFDAYKSLP